jgi:hypothetical protein
MIIIIIIIFIYLLALNMNYRENSVRIVVIISDAPPHGLGEVLDGFPEGILYYILLYYLYYIL